LPFEREGDFHGVKVHDSLDGNEGTLLVGTEGVFREHLERLEATVEDGGEKSGG
jgi:hypothetical protein